MVDNRDYRSSRLTETKPTKENSTETTMSDRCEHQTILLSHTVCACYLCGQNFDLSGANISQDITHAQCSFSGFGECGRMIRVVLIDGAPVFWSGCLVAKSLDEIIEYINRPDQECYLTSHKLGVNFLLEAIDYGYRI